MKIVAVCCALLIVFGCKKDDPEPVQIPEIVVEPPAYEFKEQAVQGKIAGATWKISGSASNNSSFGSDLQYYVVLYSETDSNYCSIFSPKQDRVTFHIPREVGLYELSFGGTNDYTVTLYDQEDNFNYIASEGAYEIVSIDTVKKEIVLNIDARAGEGTFVNGKVTIPICY